MNAVPGILDPVVLQPPVTTNGGVTSTYLSMKNVQSATIICTFTQAVAHATTASIYEATSSAGASAQAITNNLPLWKNTDISTTSVLTRADDAKSGACAATVKNQVIVFKVDPSLMDLADSMDYINVVVSDSSQATNYVSIVAIVVPRYGTHDQVSHV